jgi:hypothetical protein
MMAAAARMGGLSHAWVRAYELVRRAAIRIDHMHHGVDQRQVGERLREVASECDVQETNS